MRKWWVFSAATVALLAACLNFGDLSGSGSSADAGSCSTSQKMCVGQCVAQTDPSVGCSGPCSACAAPPNVQPACTLQNNTEVCGIGACNAQYGDCDNNPSNGCETQITTTKSCGSCSTSCAPLPYCQPSGSGYVCSSSCDAPNVVCAGECVDTSSNNGNCGNCGVSCTVANGVGTCTNSTCSVTCDANYFVCGGACIAPTSHACGASCVACAGGATCDTAVGSPTYGMCVLAGGGTECDAGACPVGASCVQTDLNKDPNCGACGVDCAATGALCCGTGLTGAKVYRCVIGDSDAGIGGLCPP